jgi:hypothetical protein
VYGAELNSTIGKVRSGLEEEAVARDFRKQ